MSREPPSRTAAAPSGPGTSSRPARTHSSRKAGEPSAITAAAPSSSNASIAAARPAVTNSSALLWKPSAASRATCSSREWTGSFVTKPTPTPAARRASTASGAPGIACMPTSRVPSRSNSTCSKRATAALYGCARAHRRGPRIPSVAAVPRRHVLVLGRRRRGLRLDDRGARRRGRHDRLRRGRAARRVLRTRRSPPACARASPSCCRSCSAPMRRAPRALLRRLDAAMMGQPAAKSAIDMAACDLAARLAGVPLAEALGGRDGETVELYRSVVSEAPAAMAERARGYARDGYRRIQVKVGSRSAGGRRAAARRARRGRGRRRRSCATPTAAGARAAALRFLQATRDLDYVLEQPCATLDECALVRARCERPLALDESVERSRLAARGPAASRAATP